MDKILSGSTTPVHSGPGSDGNEKVLCNTQVPSIIEAKLSDCHIKDSRLGNLTPLQRRSLCILQPQPTVQYAKKVNIDLL